MVHDCTSLRHPNNSLRRPVLVLLWLLKVSTGGTSSNPSLVQQATAPILNLGAVPSSSLHVTWETKADKSRPRVLGYALEYAEADRFKGSPGGDASDYLHADWRPVSGDSQDTWDVTVRVDGFDRSIGKKHTVQDGWFTLIFSKSYPKPSSLPDLRAATEPLEWSESWVTFEIRANDALRGSGHPRYSKWRAAVVRCDETEERSHEMWAGGCEYEASEGYTWHLRFVPPEDQRPAPEDYPIISVEKETVTAKWSGDGSQVLAKRYGSLEHAEQDGGEQDLTTATAATAATAAPGAMDLIDPFFCQNGM